MDRRTWTELIEYAVVAVLAVLAAVLLAEPLSGPLWGGLSAPLLR